MIGYWKKRIAILLSVMIISFAAGAGHGNDEGASDAARPAKGEPRLPSVFIDTTYARPTGRAINVSGSGAAAAQAFADAAEPSKALFIAGGLPATFVEDLEALLPTLDTATGSRQDGLFDQTAGTAGLETLADQGLQLIQQLRPMMRVHLKNQPALLEAWNLASRVARRRGGKKEEEEPVTPASAPAPAPAPALGS